LEDGTGDGASDGMQDDPTDGTLDTALDNAGDGEAKVKWDDWDWDLVNENTVSCIWFFITQMWWGCCHVFFNFMETLGPW